MAWEASMFPHGSHTHAAAMFFVFYLALMVKFALGEMNGGKG